MERLSAGDWQDLATMLRDMRGRRGTWSFIAAVEGGDVKVTVCGRVVRIEAIQ